MRTKKRHKIQLWEPDFAAINRAKQVLGITLPVEFYSTLTSHTRVDAIACYLPRVRISNPNEVCGHILQIDTRRVGAHQASDILWHELAHAYQAEHNTEGWNVSFAVPQGELSKEEYLALPVEIHAQYVADLMSPIFSLINPLQIWMRP